MGWGQVAEDGSEIWHAKPVFPQMPVRAKDWTKLVFYPKKFFLYRFIRKNFRAAMRERGIEQPYRILDVGCGTGSSVIDLKRAFGRRCDVEGLDVVQLQVEVGNETIKQQGINATLHWYDGGQFPFSDGVFDAIYTSDVLGHVPDARAWLAEIARVLRPGGTLAMFTESQLGRHAFVRNFLSTRGLNVDPHAQFHISLHSKSELREMIADAGFEIHDMRTAFWASFFVHPDEFHPVLNATDQHRFFFLRITNKMLYWIKKKTHPFSTAAAELYGLVEMYVFGRRVEAQGYVVLAKKK